jgi:hypothetical protein
VLDKGKILDLFRFQSVRRVTTLYKNFLFILEDLKNDGSISEAQYQSLRKKILDLGNDTSREMEDDIIKIFDILK